MICIRAGGLQSSTPLPIDAKDGGVSTTNISSVPDASSTKTFNPASAVVFTLAVNECKCLLGARIVPDRKGPKGNTRRRCLDRLGDCEGCIVFTQCTQFNGQCGGLAHVVEHGIHCSHGCALVRRVDDEKQLLGRRLIAQ